MIKKLLFKIPYYTMVLSLVWVALSFIDIVIDNNGAAVHSYYNFFNIFLEVFAK